MSIGIGQIQSLLSAYHKQQVHSRLTEAKFRSGNTEGEASYEDKVVISAEAKRLQIYQKTAEEVLKRLREETRKTLGQDVDGVDADEVDGEPSSGLQEP